MTLLQGALADRDAWSTVGECAIEKTMAAVGTKSAMLIRREASYRTTRFDDFARRVGITKAAASSRLAELVELGLLTRRRYREPGQRTRDEYILTETGIDFMPVVFAMFEWGGEGVISLAKIGCDSLTWIVALKRQSKSVALKAIQCRPRSSACSWSGGIRAVALESTVAAQPRDPECDVGAEAVGGAVQLRRHPVGSELGAKPRNQIDRDRQDNSPEEVGQQRMTQHR